MYRKVANLVGSAADPQLVSSVVLCGSTAKNDIVPGWSDLDIIIVSVSEWPNRDLLVHVRDVLSRATAQAPIGVGIDVAGRALLRSRGRIGGRPLAMTYEVAQYGEILFGETPFDSIPPLESVRREIIQDAWSLTLAELHNWQRYYCTRASDQPTDTLANSIKTCLKLLKHAVEPDTVLPFTHESYLEAFEEKSAGADVAELFRTAVRSRRVYLELSSSPDDADEVATRLESSLSSDRTIEGLANHHAKRS